MKHMRKFFHLLISSSILFHVTRTKDFCPPFVQWGRHESTPSYSTTSSHHQHRSKDKSFHSIGNYNNGNYNNSNPVNHVPYAPVYNQTNNASRSGWPASDPSYIDISPSIANRHGKAGKSHSQDSQPITSHFIPPYLYDYNAQQLKEYFQEKGYSEQEILDFDLLYTSKHYREIVQTYPGYGAALEKLHNKLKKLNILQRGKRLLPRKSPTYKVNLWKIVKKLYKKFQKQKRIAERQQQKTVAQQQYVPTVKNQTVHSNAATVSTIVSTIEHEKLPIAHAEVVHVQQQVTDICESRNIIDPIEQKEFLVEKLGLDITELTQNSYKGRDDHIHLVNNVTEIDVHNTTIDIVSTNTDYASIGKGLDTIAEQVLTNAKLCDLDFAQEAEDLISDSLHVIQTPHNDAEFVFNVAAVNCILGDIQSQVDGIVEGQPIVWEQPSPELLLDAISTSTDLTPQACESLIHTARFTIDTTFGTAYLPPKIYQQRCDTFLNFLESSNEVTAENIINVSAKTAADFVFDQGFISTGDYLTKLNTAIETRTQVAHVADTFKNAVETRLVENISDICTQIQAATAQTSEVSGDQLQKNVELTQGVLNVHDTHIINQLAQDWLSRKDTAYNSTRLEERLDALNKVKVTQGPELAAQLHKELAESRSHMQELDRDFSHNDHVRMLSPFVHLRIDQAARESNPIVAFELSDFCDMTTKVLAHGMRVLYDAGYAVNKGVMSGIKHTFSIEHWKDMAKGTVHMGALCVNALSTIYEDAIDADCIKHNTHRSPYFGGQEQLLSRLEARKLRLNNRNKVIVEAMQKTSDKLATMSWQEILESGAELGTTMILDTLVFHTAGELANVASNTFIKELAKGAESGQLFTQEYLVEVAGVGKMAIEKGIEPTASMFESMNEANNLTKNISKMGKSETLVTASEGTIVKNVESAAEDLSFKISNNLTKVGEESQNIINASELFEHSYADFATSIKKEIDVIRQIPLPKGLTEINYEHLFGIDIKWTKKPGELSKLGGFHHDFNNAIENSGLIKLVTEKTFNEHGCYVVDVVIDGVRPIKKTFFPSDWSCEKVMRKIFEAYENFQKSNMLPATQGGRSVMEGLTNEGITVRMVIESGHMISAYPIVPR